MRPGWLLIPWLVACTQRREPSPSIEPETLPPSQAAMPRTPQQRDLGADAPLEAGAVRWEGMVLPTKGGYSVRGVTLDGGLFVDKLNASALDSLPSDPEWFLGAVVRVSGELRQVSDEASRDGGLAVQTRAGTWFVADQVHTIELVRRALQIEGVLARSKGLWSVDRYLVNHRDLEWALVSGGGGKAGARVRLWGQPRTVVCDPRAQCLEGGSLPLFDVARARVLP